MANATQARHTPEELLSVSDRLMLELINGRIVEREPLGLRLDALVSNLMCTVGRFVDERRLGVMNGGQGSYQIFPDDPEKVRIPDFSFTHRGRLPEGGLEKGHGKIAPDLVFEMISPRDRAVDVQAKIRDFLNAGVPLIWVANPETCDVHVYRSDGTVALLQSGDVLDGGDVLPGFQCPVADLFTLTI